MNRFAVTLLAAALFAAPASAALKTGDRAPDFTAQASLGGKEFTFALADALKKGPVVLYFYPAAFTTGCTVEAHDFAEATDKFAALGATVIGVSHDDIATLDKFSTSECRSKFAVAADADQHIMKSYDAVLGEESGPSPTARLTSSRRTGMCCTRIPTSTPASMSTTRWRRWRAGRRRSTDGRARQIFFRRAPALARVQPELSSNLIRLCRVAVTRFSGACLACHRAVSEGGPTCIPMRSTWCATTGFAPVCSRSSCAKDQSAIELAKSIFKINRRRAARVIVWREDEVIFEAAKPVRRVN